jgi:hypothetical protein
MGYPLPVPLGLFNGEWRKKMKEDGFQSNKLIGIVAMPHPTLETKEDLITWIRSHSERSGLCKDFAYSVYLHDNWEKIATVCYLSTITNNAIDLMGLDIPKGNNEGNEEWHALKSVVYETNSQDTEKMARIEKARHEEALSVNGFKKLTLEMLEQFAGKKIIIELTHARDWAGDVQKQHVFKVFKGDNGIFYFMKPRASKKGLLATNYLGNFAKLV